MFISIITFTFESQTLKITKMRKTLTFAEFQKINCSNVNDYQAARIADAEKRAEEISKIWPVELLIEVDEFIDNGITKFYYEHCNMKLVTPKSNYAFFISYDGKKYHIYERTTDRLEFMSYETMRWIREVKKDQLLPEPNQIGVLNVKKIQAWLDYHSAFITVCLEEQANRADKVAKFKAAVLPLEHDYLAKDGSQGRILKGNLRFDWSIDRSGYISQKVTYTGSNTLESFLKS